MDTTSPIPMLWVLPRDIIKDIHPAFLASLLGRLEGVQVWEFKGGGVAFAIQDVLVKHGRPVDYQSELKKTRPVFKFLKPHLIPDRSVTQLEIPDNKYWVRMSLKPGETDHQFCRRFKSQLKDWNPFSFYAYTSYELQSTELESVRKFLGNWLSNAGNQTIHGESLSLGHVELIEYASPATEKSYPETGYEVHCSSYTPCTWPWIDLYLKMRRELPVKKRLSIRFFNPEAEPELLHRAVPKLAQ